MMNQDIRIKRDELRLRRKEGERFDFYPRQKETTVEVFLGFVGMAVLAGLFIYAIVY